MKMVNISLGDPLYKVVSCILWLCCLIVGMIWPEGYLALAISALTLFFVGAFVSERSSLHMMFFMGYCTFLFLPAILNWYYLDVEFSLFFYSSFVAVFFLFLTRNTTINEFVDYGFPVKNVFLIFCLLMLLFIFLDMDAVIAALFAFLIMLMSMSFKQGKIFNNSLVFLCFFAVLCMHLLFSWSGYGRTVVAGWLLLACLQFAYSMSFYINKYLFGMVPGFGAALMASRDLLQLKFTGFKDVLHDSAYGPYRTASSFTEILRDRGYDVMGFIDQVVFTFFVFIPRAIWSDKPYGFGFEYTLRHYDASLIDAGHSIASTLVGDHIYYLGYFGLFTSLLIFYIIASGANLLYRIKGLNGNGLLIFSASMMVLVWGGMTSFSARVVVPGMVFVLFTIFLKRLLTHRLKLLR